MRNPVMGQVTAIFRKDTRRLWPQLAAALVLTAFLGLMDSKTSSSGAASGLVEILWALCWTYVSVSLIQQERLPGDRQYWLARPYDWRLLLSAKALFLVAFAGMPLVIVKAAALTVNGVSPFRHASMVLCTALFFAGLVALTSAALAALTESLLQFLWAVLALAAVVAAAMLLGGGSADWGMVAWLRWAAGGALVATVAVPVLLLQYSRRATFVSRAIVAGAVLVAVAAPAENAWHSAWTLQRKLKSPHRDSTPVAFFFDAASRPRIRYADASHFPGLQQEGFYLPIRVDGIPPGAALVSKRLAATIEGDAGGRWTSGWTAEGAITGTDPLEDPHFIHADGPAWLYLNVDRAFYRALRDTSVRIHVAVAAVLLGGVERAGILANGRTDRLPEEGICEVHPAAIPLPNRVRGIHGLRSLGAFCAWPRPGPERAYLLTALPASGGSSRALLSAGSGGPLSTDQSVWQRGAALIPVRDAEPRFTVETWRAEAWLERSFDIDDVRLSGYAAPRVTDPQ
jgi:hypothetical protein